MRRATLVFVVSLTVLVPSAHGTRTGCSQGTTISDFAASWSPDGSKIAFVRTFPGCFKPTALHVVNADGGGLIVDEASMNSYEAFDLQHPYAWSPDGARIAYRDRVFDLPTRKSSVVASGFSAAEWSPDGRSLLGIVSNPYEDLVLIGADGRGRRSLTTSKTASEVEPRWSPRGDLIAFRIETRERKLGVVAPDGSGYRVIYDGPAYGYRWSPDGTQLAFYRPKTKTGTFVEQLYVLRLGGQGRVLAAGRGMGASQIEWLPDGKRIAFGRYDNGTDSATIHTVAATGGNQRVLARGRDPDWAPGGARLLLVDNRGCRTRHGVFVASADGSAPRRLTNDCHINGTAQSERINGTAADDVIDAREGDDVVQAGSGNDSVIGGAGNDVLHGGGEWDRMWGGAGDDALYAEGGRDGLYGGPGRDLLVGSIGKDTIYAADGETDVIRCGGRRDRVVADRRDSVARDCESVVRR